MIEKIAIGGLQRFSSIDFPGKLACVVFLRGCNMDCFYCHNRVLIAGSNSVLRQEEVLEFLGKRVGLLEGVVVTGGEPLLQKGLVELLKYIKSLGYAVKLDTNGLLSERLEEIVRLQLVDFVALDIKALPEDYPAVCKVGAGAWQTIRQSLNLLIDLSKGASDAVKIPQVEVRTTLYPGFTAEKLQTLAANLPPLPAWRLNFFRRPEEYCDETVDFFARPSLSPGILEEIKDSLLQIQPGVFW